MNRQRICLCTRCVTSYIIFGKSGEALPPLLAKGIIFFKQAEILKLGIKNLSENVLIYSETIMWPQK